MTNPINEPGSWDLDFSYDYLEALCRELVSRFALSRLGDAAAVPADTPTAFVRHDIDVSLRRARPLAELESAWGVCSTYHVTVVTCDRQPVLRNRLGRISGNPPRPGRHGPRGRPAL